MINTDNWLLTMKYWTMDPESLKALDTCSIMRTNS